VQLPIAIAEFLGHHGFAGRSIIGEEHAEIFVHLFDAGKYQRFAKPTRLVGIGFAAAVEDCGDFPPPRSRQVRSVDNLAFDVFDPLTGVDAEGDSDLDRRGMGAAGAVGPRMKRSRLRQASRTTSLKVTSARWPWRCERAACRAVGSRDASSSTARLARSIISFWSRRRAR